MLLTGVNSIRASNPRNLVPMMQETDCLAGGAIPAELVANLSGVCA